MTRQTDRNFGATIATDDPDLELIVTGTATPYDPGVTSGPPERCYPPEGGEVEIDKVWLYWSSTKWSQWLEISPLIRLLDAWDVLQELVEVHVEELGEELGEAPEESPDAE